VKALQRDAICRRLCPPVTKPFGDCASSWIARRLHLPPLTGELYECPLDRLVVPASRDIRWRT
jgi:hypothetical protein